MSIEPQATALATFIVSVLILAAAVLTRLGGRVGVPGAMLFIGLGMLAGSEGLGRIPFENYELTFRIGTLALALILFDGGLNTPLSAVRQGVRPAAVLATLGVVVTALVMAGAARLLGLPTDEALLVGAIVASTDAAAVFSVLRGSGIHLKRRVGVTLELESGLNDPVAIILTMAFTASVVGGEPVGAELILDVFVQLGIGLIGGLLIGFAGTRFLLRARFQAGGLYPASTLAIALLAFGGTTLVGGSGFLAVYVAALWIGSSEVPYTPGLRRTHDALAWISQILMFLLLGLLAFPSRLLDVAVIGLALGLALAFVARPIAVLLSLLPFAYPLKERLYISWVGLRGAVPIILATFPVMAGATHGRHVFDIVFFIVVVNAFIPGMTVRYVTAKLGLRSDAPPPPPAVVEVTSLTRLSERVLSFYIDERSAAAHVPISELSLPRDTSVLLVVRGSHAIPPRGHVVLEPGDHVFVLLRPEDEATVRVMLGSVHEP